MELHRRDFLKLIGASTVATALPGCGIKKPKSLIPYIIPEENIVPGKAVWYASVCQECPAGCGISVRVREGRAVKVEGNPLHPVNGGALCARGQASLHGLYNPDRIQQPMKRRSNGGWDKLSWEEAEKHLVEEVGRIRRAGRGGDVALMTQHASGALDELADLWLASVGSKRRYRYEPFAHESIKTANARMFGLEQVPTYDVADAETILCFGADFLETWLSPVAFTKGFSRHRGFKNGRRGTTLFVGARLSLTATNADEWIQANPGTEGIFALGLVKVILDAGAARGLRRAEATRIGAVVRPYAAAGVEKATGVPVERLKSTALKFAKSPSSVAIVGGTTVEGDEGAASVAAVNLLNYVCGNFGRTVKFNGTSISRLARYREIVKLVDEMNAEKVSALVFADANPVFDTPNGLDFGKALKKVPFKVSMSSFMSETAAFADLILPTHTPLESWGDVEIEPGIYSLMQPSMQPLFNTKMLGDIFLESGRAIGGAGLAGARTMHEYLKEKWTNLHKKAGGTSDPESFWIESLARGGYWESRTHGTQIPKILESFDGSIFSEMKRLGDESGKTYTLILYPSLSHYDGRGANRPWLQELPDPMTMNVWDTWIEIHPQDAAAAGIKTGDAVQVSSPYARFDLPAQVSTTMKPGVVAIPLGQGHTAYGRYADGVGRNPIDLLDPKPSEKTGGIEWVGTSVELLKKPKGLALANVSGSGVQHGRGIIQSVPSTALVGALDLKVPDGKVKEGESMYAEHDHPNHRWGMAIDVDKCTGCSACVTACYVENNIPVVGKEEVSNGREMSWIRIERYFDEQSSTPRADFIPMLCQQCDDAPCETVCPVYAAYHTEEGLNGQVYNRCIGTRYCANNCPYKVRRFNWFEASWAEPLNWQLNPDVTVRSKGVMEKCTFCVQRIVDGKNTARNEHRPVRDGEIIPACAQTCPAEAITFGDLKDPKSRLTKLMEDEDRRVYKVLEELNTRPAVTYLKAIRKDA